MREAAGAAAAAASVARRPQIESTHLFLHPWQCFDFFFSSVLLPRNPPCLFPLAEYEDASLSSWVNKERFQGYLQIDGFTLYELGETGGVCLKKKPP